MKSAILCAEVFSLSPTPLRPCCYRKRLAFSEDAVYYTNKNNILTSTGDIAYTSTSEIYDILQRDNVLFAINSTGEIAQLGKSSSQINQGFGKCGLFSAIEATDNFIVGAHDMSHSVRIVDFSTAKTVNSIVLPGLINGLSKSKNDIIIVSDDQSLSVIDPREMNFAARSGVLVSKPTTILGVEEKVVVCCEDRKIRIFDQRKLKTPLITTKPSTKNGTMSLYSENTEEIVCIGCDEAMTLVEHKKDIGQIKRSKYLAETPWISSPVFDRNNNFCLLTRGGVVHKFSDPIEFLKNKSK